MVNVPWCHDCNKPLGLCTCVEEVKHTPAPAPAQTPKVLVLIEALQVQALNLHNGLEELKGLMVLPVGTVEDDLRKREEEYEKKLEGLAPTPKKEAGAREHLELIVAADDTIPLNIPEPLAECIANARKWLAANPKPD